MQPVLEPFITNPFYRCPPRTVNDTIAYEIVDCLASRRVRVLMANPFEDEKGDFVVLANEEGAVFLVACSPRHTPWLGGYRAKRRAQGLPGLD